MNEKNYEAIIEAILFTMGESVELSRIAAAVELPEEEAEAVLCGLRDKYEEEGRGMRLSAWKVIRGRCVPTAPCTNT